MTMMKSEKVNFGEMVVAEPVSRKQRSAARRLERLCATEWDLCDGYYDYERVMDVAGVHLRTFQVKLRTTSQLMIVRDSDGSLLAMMSAYDDGSLSICHRYPLHHTLGTVHPKSESAAIDALFDQWPATPWVDREREIIDRIPQIRMTNANDACDLFTETQCIIDRGLRRVADRPLWLFNGRVVEELVRVGWSNEFSRLYVHRTFHAAGVPLALELYWVTGSTDAEMGKHIIINVSLEKNDRVLAKRVLEAATDPSWVRPELEIFEPAF